MRDHALAVPDADDGVTLATELTRRARATSLRVARRLDWSARPRRYPRPRLCTGELGLDQRVYARRVALNRHDAGAIEVLEQGKRVNVALASPSLDGLLLEPGVPFSFWRAVGRPSVALGYRHGMEVRGGCVVPSLGGGLCLLTNALFRAAAEMGWHVLERHGHTMEVIPSADVPWGVDATAAWPYVDLRFALPDGAAPARLGVRVDADAVVLEVWSSAPRPSVELRATDDRVEVIDGERIRSNRIVRRMVVNGVEQIDTIAVNRKRLIPPAQLSRSCLTCDLTDCSGRVIVP